MDNLNKKPKDFDKSTEFLEKELKKLKEINTEEMQAILHSAFPSDLIVATIEFLENEIKNRKQLYISE